MDFKNVARRIKPAVDLDIGSPKVTYNYNDNFAIMRPVSVKPLSEILGKALITDRSYYLANETFAR
jgi:hypothetical protein